MSDEAKKPIDVGSAIAEMIEFLAELSWIKLGLRTDPMMGEVRRDLVQAKLAIDSVSSLADQILPQLDPDDQRRIQKLVTDLRLNFVTQKEMAGE